MSDFWEDVKKTASKAVKLVSKKTKEFSKLSSLNLKLANLKIEKKGLYTKLGELFYKYNKKQKLNITDKKIFDLISNVNTLTKKENKLKKDIKTTKEVNK